jgi:4-carboxymuconolactone decarboxylase
VFDRIAGGPRGGVRGPFRALLHSPGLTARLERVGHYLRYESALPARIREMAIMTVSAHCHCDVEWSSHLKFAKESGLSDAVLQHIAAGNEPDFEEASDAIAYRFVREVIANKGLGESVLQDMLATFGEEGTVELNVVVGYYTLLSMVLVSFAVPGTGPEAPWAKVSGSD